MQQPINEALSLYYDEFGHKENSAIVLIPGLGSQGISWSDSFCDNLAKLGFYILRIDNRDCGLSPQLNNASVPDLQALSRGEIIDIPYSLPDMAADIALTLDNAKIKQAHIVGRSMGGLIAQLFAALYPEKTLSLCAIMSTTGNSTLPKTSDKIMGMMLSPKPDPFTHQKEYLEQQLAFLKCIATYENQFDERYYTEFLIKSLSRSYSPAGTMRQIAAMAITGDIRSYLSSVVAPTLIIHGTVDPIFSVESAYDIERNIKLSTLHLIDGMGHEIPPILEDDIVSLLQQHFITSFPFDEK